MGVVTRRRAPGYTTYRRSGYGPGAAYTSMLGPPGTGTELKSVDSHIDVTFNAASGNLVAIGMPIQTPSFFGRIANRTRGVAIEIRGIVGLTATNSNPISNQVGRMLVIYDRQPNGTPPSAPDILKDYAYDGSTITNEYSKLNMTNRDRFLILRDRPIFFAAVGANGGAPGGYNMLIVNDPNASNVPTFLVNEHIELKGLQTQYSASSIGSTADVSTGAYYILTIDQTGAGEGAFALDAHCRYKYYD